MEDGEGEIYGRWKGRTKVSFRRDKKVATDKAACQCRAAILSGKDTYYESYVSYVTLP